ncbi:MAG TPA: DMT family transporter [Anaerolineales bacterium]|nr:DMT family transporter [Anaerolineales bacterium]
MNASSDHRRSVLFIILAASLWSTSGVMIKIISWQPIAILAGRSIFSSLVFLVYLRRIPTQWTRWKVLASAAYILTQFLFIWSTKLTTAANAIFLQYTAPIYVILLALWFLHERPSRVDWSSMLIIFIGMLLFFGDKLSTDGFYGNLLAVLSGVTSAFMTVSLRAQKDGVPAESILAANLFTAVLGIPFILRESWTAANWLILLYLGTVQMGLSFLLFTNAIKHVPALEANLISTLEPVLNPVWVFLFLGEAPGRFALIGGLIVLGGVALNALSAARAPEGAPASP